MLPTMEDLEHLVELYKSYRLPLPPADAPLVVGEFVPTRYGPAKRRFAGYALLPYDSNRQTIRGWFGTTEAALSTPDLSLAGTNGEDAGKYIVVPIGPLPFQEDMQLAIAVTEKARGHDDFALTILADEENGYSFNACSMVKAEVSDWEGRVQVLAVNHWLNVLVNRTSGRAEVRRELAALNAKNPEFAWYLDEVIASLELTLQNRYHGSDPIEQLIDRLCDDEIDAVRHWSPHRPDERYNTVVEIVDQGFEAVPALLRHCEDRRYTRGYSKAPVSGGTLLVTIGEVCSEILDSYRGVQDTAMRTFNIGKAGLEVWWSEAEQLGEAEACYIALTVAKWFPGIQMRMIEKRCPEILEGALAKIITNGNEASIGALFDSMKRTGAPQETLIKLALTAARSKNLNHVYWALWTLREEDPELFEHELTRCLLEFPASPSEEAFAAIESQFGHLVAHCQAAEPWEALRIAAQRAEVGLRLELLKNSSTDRSSAACRHYVTSLLAFFEDTSDAPEDSVVAVRGSWTYLKRVQDMAVCLVAEQIGIDGCPLGDAARGEWHSFRSLMFEHAQAFLVEQASSD